MHAAMLTATHSAPDVPREIFFGRRVVIQPIPQRSFFEMIFSAAEAQWKIAHAVK